MLLYVPLQNYPCWSLSQLAGAIELHDSLQLDGKK
jgi:hypothetical protein